MYFSAFLLSSLYQNEELLKDGLPLNATEVIISTNVPESLLDDLKDSYLFIANSTYSKNLVVYDLLNQTIDFNDTEELHTAVFFSFKDDVELNPEYHARVKMNQIDKDGKLSININLPADNVDCTSVFNNPLGYYVGPNLTTWHFSNVEPLSIKHQIFTLSLQGIQKITVDSFWDNSNTQNTTAGTTTGLVSYNEKFDNQELVRFSIDQNRYAEIGYGFYYNMTNQVNITMSGTGSTGYSGLGNNGSANKGVISFSPFPYEIMTVETPADNTGFMYLQYFTVELEAMTTTEVTTPTITSTTPSTTTSYQSTTPKSTSSSDFVSSIVMSAILFCFV